MVKPLEKDFSGRENTVMMALNGWCLEETYSLRPRGCGRERLGPKAIRCADGNSTNPVHLVKVRLVPSAGRRIAFLMPPWGGGSLF